MRIPRIRGIIRRRILVNFRADPGVVERLLPEPFRPKLHGGHALVGICLIRLEKIRPVGLPAFLGVSSENAAHRIAVEWTDHAGTSREGVYIPRRDSGAWLNRLAGGRIFPGKHHAADFSVLDRWPHLELSMKSSDGVTTVKLVSDEARELPASSCFSSLSQASEFFKTGSLGYSPSSDPKRSDGLVLRTDNWRVDPLAVTEVHSSYFSNSSKFPAGSVHFDHALIMRDIPHEWHWAEDMHHEPSPGLVRT
jgi:Uncharacterized conserved protein (COG2071)